MTEKKELRWVLRDGMIVTTIYENLGHAINEFWLAPVDAPDVLYGRIRGARRLADKLCAALNGMASAVELYEIDAPSAADQALNGKHG